MTAWYNCDNLEITTSQNRNLKQFENKEKSNMNAYLGVVLLRPTQKQKDEGETVKITPEVSDVNGDDLKITISSPLGNDGEWETDFTDHGVYEITVKATDGTATSTKTFTLTVDDVNKAPEIIDIVIG